ncbi:E3 ubiquitin-protein ligase makorin-like isoform X1 [Cicer arietinum]|uniref:E3 ubiquitin-protein ligase makorin-like isoform X1 n=2 Tax=Cicer arietinum TaxID=3827 RepID=A0A1S2Y5S6_CICAR|nr:E3 ubiquitin-protein ligase makorin-like isoform X1 [Cicer arietinum]
MSNRVCKFHARGVCLKGEQCDFSHQRKDTPVDATICSYYQKGSCAYGSRCRYKHVRPSEASSSASMVSDSAVPVSNRFGKVSSNWVPKGTKVPSPDKRVTNLQRKHQEFIGNSDFGESSTASARPHEQLFCKYAAANCPNRDRCTRIHGNQCLYCRKYCLHPVDKKEKENHLRTCDKKEKYLLALKNSEEIECNVCLERVLSKPKPSECKFGLLPECDHAFCLSCIRNWRSSSAPTSGLEINSINANTVRTCPVCRKLSYFVIPSGIWYTSKEEKQEIIDNYKESCRLIDCKHFSGGNGNCPFGAGCFYKHTVRPGSYTWVHNRPPHNRPPPPRRNQNNFGMNDVLEMLGEVDLSGGEFYSIMRDMDIFEGMDPFEMMAIADSLAGGSAPCMGPFDSNDEGDDEFDLFQMAALSEALADGVDDFGPDDFYDEMDPMDAALLSMMMHSHMEEDDEDEEYSDEQY